MFVKLRLGCMGTAFLVGLALLLFWRPISRRMTDWTFDQTTARVVSVLPEPERVEARELCEDLWTHVRDRGIPPEHAERFGEFRAAAFGMLKNDEVTEDEAREFLSRVREILEEMYAGDP
jgi:hypothetical protein